MVVVKTNVESIYLYVFVLVELMDRLFFIKMLFVYVALES